MTEHPIASLVPKMTTQEFALLKADIREHGQREPITMYEGKVLDGRHRMRACEELGIKPATREFKDGEPIAFVTSENVKRRHLTIGQRAMIAAKAIEMYEKLAKDRQRMSEGRGKKVGPIGHTLNSGRSREHAGRSVGVGGRTVDRARHVLKEAEPELIAAVVDGRVKVGRAAELTVAPPDVQRAEAANPTQRNGKKSTEPDELPGEITVKGVGIVRAHEAINCLTRIPKNDALRKRGFQVVTDWIRHNR